MCYPPGIPILAPGEMITQEIIDYIVYAKEKGCSMQGTEDPEVEYLNVLIGMNGEVRGCRNKGGNVKVRGGTLVFRITTRSM